MEFLYPKFDKPTHVVIGDIGVSNQFPKYKSFENSKDVNLFIRKTNDQGDIISEGTKVCVIRENIGHECLWSYVKLANATREFYILNSNLENIGNKETFIPKCIDFNQPNDSFPEINPNLKENFIPYVDRRNGLYSVRIKTDYDRILDSGQFEKLTGEVLKEGAKLLLFSRGLQSDDSTVESLIQKYYTFAYINRDLDLTVKRDCDPISFTVSIPLSFFNESQGMRLNTSRITPTRIISFTNKDYTQIIQNLTNILYGYSGDIEKLKYPNKEFDTFVVSFEVNNLTFFSNALNELLEIAGAPINIEDADTTTYEIGLNDLYDLVSFKITTFIDNNLREIEFPEGLLSMARMRGEFNSKRIFYYLENYLNIVNDAIILNANDFITKHVHFPDPVLKEENVTVGNINFTPEQVKEFRLKFEKNSASCVMLQDVLGLTRDIGGLFDPKDPKSGNAWALYNLFVPNDPQNQLSIDNLFDSFKANLDATKKYYDNRKKADKTSIIPISYGFFESTADALGRHFTKEIPKSFMSLWTDANGNLSAPNTINTLWYIVRRLHIEEWILKAILCNLKNINPNDAAIIASIPTDVLNYANYLFSYRELTGMDWIRVLEKGINFDIQLICNDELSYALKSLRKFFGATSILFTQITNFTNQLQRANDVYQLPEQYRNPYIAIIDNALETAEQLIINLVFDYISFVITQGCESPLDQLTDYEGILSTHAPVQRYGGTQNNDNTKIRNNRRRALELTFPEIINNLTFGPDVDYTLDLLQDLFTYLKCILSASEMLNLIKGNPSEEVVIIIKNVIRAKYSEDPNNLSYLLDQNRLLLFFKRIGDSLDKNAINDLEKFITDVTIGNGKKWIDICTPEQYETRKAFYEGKLPPNLDVLEDSNKRNLKKVQDIIEKMKAGPQTIKLSALCPDKENDGITAVKENLVNKYKDSLKSMFSETLTVHGKESSNLSGKYEIKRKYGNEDTNGKTLDYSIYQPNLYLNMADVDPLPKAQTITPAKNSNFYKIVPDISAIKYLPKDRSELSTQEISDMFLTTDRELIQAEDCPVDTFKENELFKLFLKQERVIYERRISNRTWGSIENTYKERNYSTEKTDFYKELVNKNPSMYEYFKQKKYLLFITREDNSLLYNIRDVLIEIAKAGLTILTLGIAGMLLYKEDDWPDINEMNSDDDFKVVFRFIYYDSIIDDFRSILYYEYLPFENSDSDDDRINKKIDRLLFLNSLSSYFGGLVVLDSKEATQAWYAKNFPDTKFIYDYLSDQEDALYFSYIATDKILKLANLPTSYNKRRWKYGNFGGVDVRTTIPDPVRTLNVIQEVYAKSIEEKVSKIETYEQIINTFERFKDGGIFRIESKYISEQNKIERNVVIATNGTDPNSIQYVKYFNFDVKDIKFNNIHIDKFIQSTKFLYRFSSQALRGTYFRYLMPGILDELDRMYNVYEGSKKRKRGEYNFKDEIKQSNRTFFPDPSWVNTTLEVYNRYNYFDINNDRRYEKCNVFPHYLNLDYFLFSALNDAKQNICDDNLAEIPLDMLDEILANLTIRTYVTDYLIKAIPALSLMNHPQLLTLYQQQDLVDALRNFLNNDMHAYTADLEFNSKDDYYTSFVRRIIKKVFKKYSEAKSGIKIKQKFVRNTSLEENKEIDYFIRKEIKHFINFALDKKIIIVNEYLKKYDSNVVMSNAFREMSRGFLFNEWDMETVEPSKDGITFNNYIKNIGKYNFNPLEKYVEEAASFQKIDNAINNTNIEILDYETYLQILDNDEFFYKELINMAIYCMMASLSEYTFKNMYGGTKGELAKIYFKRTEMVEVEGETSRAYKQKTEEDIVKFITSLAYAANPALKAEKNFDYMKYVVFALEAWFDASKQILLTTAMATDGAVKAARLINFSIATAGMISWSFVEPEQKEQMMKDAIVNDNLPAAYSIQRLNDGKSFIPDWSMIAIFWASFGLITDVGIAYSIFDFADEIRWFVQTGELIDSLRQTYKQEDDPCRTDPIPPEEPGCTPEKLKEVRNLLDKYEE